MSEKEGEGAKQMSTPWNKDQQMAMGLRIKQLSEKMQAELGASHVMMVVCFEHEDGVGLHMVDGGHFPMAPAEMYRGLVAAHESGYGHLDLDDKAMQ